MGIFSMFLYFSCENELIPAQFLWSPNAGTAPTQLTSSLKISVTYVHSHFDHVMMMSFKGTKPVCCSPQSLSDARVPVLLPTHRCLPLCSGGRGRGGRQSGMAASSPLAAGGGRGGLRRGIQAHDASSWLAEVRRQAEWHGDVLIASRRRQGGDC
jgi:hypothetical protein